MRQFVESAAGRLGDLNIHLDLTSPSPARSTKSLSMSRRPSTASSLPGPRILSPYQARTPV